MKRAGWIALCAAIASSPIASADPARLTLGTVRESGPRVRGHGGVLKRALAFELSRSASYSIVADSFAIKEATKKILETNRPMTREDQWIEIGKAAGASHLLVGEVREATRGCTAFAQVIELQSLKSTPSRPETYDCTERDLAELASVIAAQLTGKAVTRPRPPLEIRVHGDQTEVDGDGYGDRHIDPKPPQPEPKIEPPKPEPPKVVSERPEPPKEEPRPPAVVLEPKPEPPPPPVAPKPEIAIPPPAPPPVAERRAPPGTSIVPLVLALPILSTLAGFALRKKTSAAGSVLGVGIGLSAALLLMELVALSADREGAVRSQSWFELLAPPVGFIAAVLAAALIVPLGEISLVRRLRWLLLAGVVLSAASQILFGGLPVLVGGLASSAFLLFLLTSRRT
jgi:hypothetical protein